MGGEGFLKRLTLTHLKESLPQGLEFSGYLKNETAYRYQNPVAFSKVLNIFQLEVAYTFIPSLRLYARTWAFYDLAYDFQDIQTIAPMKPLEFIQPPDPGEPEPNIENIREISYDPSGVLLKEFYLDVFMPSADLRIGKQIVRWGIVEGWRVLDQINPLDFTEHILRDVTDRYIPLWMVKADYYLGPLTFEGLWIPDVRGHKPAPIRSEWSQFQVLPDFNPVPRNFENSEWGGRISGVLGGVEMVYTSLYHWDDFPTAFRSVSGLGLGSLGISPEVTFTPVQRRLQTNGIGLSKSFGKIVLEGEVAYNQGKYWGTEFRAEGGASVFGEAQRDFVTHVLGVKTVLFGADLSLNFSQDIILKHVPEIQQDRIENTGSFFARKEIRYGTLVPQLLVITLINRNEWLYRPKLEFKYSDKVTFLFGIDIFTGAPAEKIPGTETLDPGRLNFFGYFDKDDRAYMEVKYSF
jgi:hypothetical protein